MDTGSGIKRSNEKQGSRWEVELYGPSFSSCLVVLNSDSRRKESPVGTQALPCLSLGAPHPPTTTPGAAVFPFRVGRVPEMLSNLFVKLSQPKLPNGLRQTWAETSQRYMACSPLTLSFPHCLVSHNLPYESDQCACLFPSFSTAFHRVGSRLYLLFTPHRFWARSPMVGTLYTHV